MNSTTCFICDSKAANPAKPITVSLKKTIPGGTKYIRVEVPACPDCQARETRAERRANGIGLAVAVIPIIVFAIIAGLKGGFLGLGIGFFGGIIVSSMLTGRSKACRYPAVKELEREGWRFNHMH